MLRGANLASMVLATALLAIPLAAEETRAANIDVVILLDKSLSMAGAEESAKRYAAGEVIGPVLVPGDRIIVETFYGQVDRLYAGTIRSEEDKAAVVRSLNAVRANGKFTDIGLALDRAAADLAELGAPEREKFVLLITDERQEAPDGSKYISTDYRLRHPALDYVRRVDLGSFRAITVGFGIAERVDAAAVKVMRLLSEPPERRAEAFSDLPSGTSAGLDGAAGAATGGGTAPDGAARTGAAGPAKDSGATAAGPGMSRNAADGDGNPSPITFALAGAGLLFAVFLAIALGRAVQLRRQQPKDEKTE